MNKKELPYRKKKGINTFNTDWKFLNSIKTKEKITKAKRKKSNYQSEHAFQVKKKQIQRRQKYIQNKLQFKYTRGIHYFYDLHTLKRLSDSPSYVLFNIQKQQSKSCEFTISFSKQNNKIGVSLISDLINRNFIGLPFCEHNNKCSFKLQKTLKNVQKTTQIHRRQLPLALQQEMVQQQVVQLNSNHKNICHKYLFSNEDRKHHIDLQINQCQHIKKKFAYYITNQTRLRQFSFIQKDNDLYELLQETLNDYQKYQLLQNKILALKEKKIRSQQKFADHDQMYFNSSLNQILYNKIKKNNEKLLKSTIYNQLLAIVNGPYNIINLQNKSASKKQSNKQIRRYNNYILVQKHCFDELILKYATKLVSIRICQQGQHIFYRAKNLFSNIFQIDFLLQKQIKPKKQQNYIKKCKQMSKQIFSFYKRNSKSSSTTDSDCQNGQKQRLNIRLNQKIVELSMDDFYFIKIFTSIYQSLLSIMEYLKKSISKSLELIDLLGSLSFPKFQNLFIDSIQSDQFGILPHCLQTLSQFLGYRKQHFQQVKWSLFSQYNSSTNEMAIFIKQNVTQNIVKINQKLSEGEKNRKRRLQKEYLSDQQIKSLQIMKKKCNR